MKKKKKKIVTRNSLSQKKRWFKKKLFLPLFFSKKPFTDSIYCSCFFLIKNSPDGTRLASFQVRRNIRKKKFPCLKATKVLITLKFFDINRKTEQTYDTSLPEAFFCFVRFFSFFFFTFFLKETHDIFWLWNSLKEVEKAKKR